MIGPPNRKLPSGAVGLNVRHVELVQRTPERQRRVLLSRVQFTSLGQCILRDD